MILTEKSSFLEGGKGEGKREGGRKGRSEGGRKREEGREGEGGWYGA